MDTGPSGLDAATAAPDAPRAVTPQVNEAREKLIRTVAVICVLYATYWIVWRWTSTINTEPAGLAPSLLLLAAETWAYVNMCLFVFLVWRLKRRDVLPPPAGATVDVFITCFDEPLEVVRRTAIGARSIRYPHRTYVLDDGKRDEVLAMARELGIGYIRRPGNANAKAGNLNFALTVTRGEFILQLDADHVPLPNILDRMLGHFRDPKMALVQSPQDFYNVDSFTHVVNEEGHRIWEENRIFYSLIQPGRDYWNASFFCGSCGIIRRSALESVGGFATETIIEDMETTILLHAAGWKTAYHNETLAYGLAPAAADAYHVQRLRWGQGAMQVLRKLKPLTRPDLTLAQRINYFAGTATYFEGWQKAIFYVAPLFFFYTGIMPIAVDETELLVRLIPYLVIAIVAFELLARGTGYLFISERYTMVRFFTYMLAIYGLFTSKKLKFNVTPKGVSGVPFRTYAPQLVLLILSVAAPVWATIAWRAGWIDYNASGWGSLAFWLNGFWAAWNTYFAYHVVKHSLDMRQERGDHRFAEQMAVVVRAEPVGEDVAGGIYPAITTDINPAGLGFRCTQRLEPGTNVSLRLPLATGIVSVSGEIRHVIQQRSRFGEAFLHGVFFQDLPIETRDAIELHCTQHAMPAWRLRYRQSIDILTRAGEVIRNLRRDRRRLVRLPARVTVAEARPVHPDDEPLYILEELSARGARLLGVEPIAPGSRVRFEVPGAGLTGEGTVRYALPLETPASVVFSIGIEVDSARAPVRTGSVRARAVNESRR